MICPIKKEYIGVLFGDKSVENNFQTQLSIKSKNLIVKLIKCIILNETNYYELKEKMKEDGFNMMETWKIMEEYTEDKKGISKDEFYKFLGDFERNFTKYEFNIIFNKFDVDKDDVIGFEDFNKEFLEYN